MPKRSSARPRLLSHGRPANAKSTYSLTSAATRSIIRKHHTLQKQLAAARRRQDATLVGALSAQLEEDGGLAQYQAASTQGQACERGGDTSSVLVRWINDILVDASPGHDCRKKPKIESTRWRLLEVGALSTGNACSKCGLFDVERIDLRSQNSGVKQQDFMQRPIPPSNPASEGELFDVVSLSLVVNFVGDPAARGEMLRRVSSFLRNDGDEQVSSTSSAKAAPLSLLFLVLPAPCVTNSRYLDQARLGEIMNHLGFEMVRKKLSSKLIYYLWKFCRERVRKTKRVWKKEEIKKGANRNNFAIVLQ